MSIKLFNPFHDKLGRFSSKTGGGAAAAGAKGSKSEYHKDYEFSEKMDADLVDIMIKNKDGLITKKDRDGLVKKYGKENVRQMFIYNMGGIEGEAANRDAYNNLKEHAEALGGSKIDKSKADKKEIKVGGTGSPFSRKNSIAYGIKEGFDANFSGSFEDIKGGTKSQQKQRKVGRAIGFLSVQVPAALAAGYISYKASGYIFDKIVGDV